MAGVVVTTRQYLIHSPSDRHGTAPFRVDGQPSNSIVVGEDGLHAILADAELLGLAPVWTELPEGADRP